MVSRKIFACAVLSAAVLLSTSSYAGDELFLCGAVQSLGTAGKSVAIDVKTDGCSGVHQFKLQDGNQEASLQVGDNRCFYIDSNEFKDGYVYTITTIDGD